MTIQAEPERADLSRSTRAGPSAQGVRAYRDGRGCNGHLAAEIEHERLLDLLEALCPRGDGSTDSNMFSDGNRSARFELVDLLDRHYVRLCRAVGRSADAAVERDLHELRVAHEWARTFEPLTSVWVILDRHVGRCPLQTVQARSAGN
jgi:hypothetical protein